MSSHGETMQRIDLAKRHGYELTMVAILTPLDKAIRQAMERAKQSRRFPHFKALPESHSGFIEHLRGYFDYFDTVLVFANMGLPNDIELVANKKSGNILEVLNAEIFNSAQFMPRKA